MVKEYHTKKEIVGKIHIIFGGITTILVFLFLSLYKNLNFIHQNSEWSIGTTIVSLIAYSTLFFLVLYFFLTLWQDKKRNTRKNKIVPIALLTIMIISLVFISILEKDYQKRYEKIKEEAIEKEDITLCDEANMETIPGLNRFYHRVLTTWCIAEYNGVLGGESKYVFIIEE